MEMRTLGTDGPRVAAIGLGCSETADDEATIATVRAALDAGVTLIDTADFYEMGRSEAVVGRALRDGGRDAAVLSVKFGALRDPGGRWLGIEGRPANVKAGLAYSLQRLGTDYIDIYRPA